MAIRKAGEKCVVARKKSPEVYQNIWKHLRSDGIPDQAANQMAAEMVTHDDFEGSVEEYQRNFANFKERGYNEHAAQAMAVEAMESGEKPQESTRFANIYG